MARIKGPGDCVSVDQIESTTPGFVGQMKGFLTKKRYHCATVYVDHYSSLSYVHIQKSTNGDETLLGKRQFEAYCASHGVKIKSYHADNGRFAENKFVADITACGQTITYCGAYAHFQNGIAEKRIRDLQDLARTMMIHARHRWPQAIEANLWPYALKMANDVHLSSPSFSPSQDLLLPSFWLPRLRARLGPSKQREARTRRGKMIYWRPSPILLQDRKSIATLSPSGIGSQDFEQKNSPLERWRSSRG